MTTKTIHLALSERAATVLRRSIDSYQPQPGVTVAETERILDEVKVEIDAQLGKPPVAALPDPEAAPKRKRKTKAEQIAAEAAKAAREAVEKNDNQQ